MESTDKSQKPFVLKKRESVKKRSLSLRERNWRLLCAVADHNLVRRVRRKGAASQVTLFVASEHHCLGVTKHSVIAPGPYKKLLQVFERETLAEEWIEHSVGKCNIWSGSPVERTPCC